jgi:branched-chain amino acid transport system substrate-binding protein
VLRFRSRLLSRRVVVVALGTTLIFAATYSVASASPSTEKSSAARNATCDTSAHDPGISSSQITVGETLPLTTAGPTPAQTVAGSNAYYDMINKAGGVKGHKIKLIARDDQYTPAVALQQMRDLIQRDRVFVIAGGQGTPNFLAEAPFVNSQKVPAIAPYAPSSELGNMKNQYVYMTAVNYTTEFQIMTKFIIQKYHPKSLSLVGVQGNVGDDSKLGMQKAMGSKKIPLQYIPEQPGTSDYTPIATQLKSNGADWVFLIITPSDTGGLLQAMKRVGYKPHLAGWAGMGDQTYINEFGNLSQGTVVAQELALASSPDPLVKKYVQQFKAQTGKTPTGFNNALGWAQAELTVKALQTAPALTRSCVLYALNRIKNFKTGILPPITFGNNNRQGVNAVGLVQIVGKGVKQIAPFRSVSQ